MRAFLKKKEVNLSGEFLASVAREGIPKEALPRREQQRTFLAEHIGLHHGYDDLPNPNFIIFYN